MIELISYGDCLTQGTFKVHSKFNRVINFVSNDKSEKNLISVVDPSIGSGPRNIVVKNFKTLSINPILNLEIKEDCFLFNNVPLYKRSSHRGKYHSKILNPSFVFDQVIEQTHKIERILVAKFLDKGITALLQKRQEDKAGSLFEKEIIKHFRFGLQKIFSGDLVGGINKIKGLGIGLTPSGDDFISGFLIALNLINSEQKNLEEIIKSVYQEAMGENSFSNTFFENASQMCLTEKMKELIQWIIGKDTDDNILEQLVNEVCSMGETSGVDMMVGFIFGIKWRNECL